MQITVKDVVISVKEGDITAWQGEMIVNASNSGLYGGGGVDGAIHRAGGPRIAEECAVIRRKQGGILPGEAALTTAGQLSFRGIIHTVGPIWKGGTAGEAAVLSRCYKSSLDLACAHGVQSLAFPNISTGIYSFPKDLACKTALESVIQYIRGKNPAELPLRQIDFICFESDNARLYEAMLGTYS
ncbi:macro domain-containing protein [Paenibacillus tritici]|uniref:Macro domain-containing protein n=1 Tax=Paenibacillus tritici TaxID=1873425 RepID=A0ABX2DH63_9BACL|nr:macro domain-containing protein [Paenibacillus tritici]NQX43912.1 macro domain-containing protein [Paenibacillus tritici]QUL57480.1 macro domain-containing protein [Paenibacillus tritici]